MMKKSNSGKHLTREERIIIETGIRNGSTKSAIADTLGKEKSTIGKEIKEHRKLRFKRSYGFSGKSRNVFVFGISKFL